jgi:peroxiredoxin
MTKLNTLLKAVLIIAFIPSCSSKLKQMDGFAIHGQMDGFEHGKVVLAKLDLVSNETIFVDSTEIKDGKFTFEGKVESPYLHTLFFNDEEMIHFFLENSKIEISANIQNIENPKITGSREDSLFRSYELDDIFDRQLGMEIMLNHPDYCFSAFTAYYQFQIHNIHSDTLDMIMEGFTDPVKESVYYEHLKNLYIRLKKVAISQPAPAFSLPDTTGNMVKLEDFRGKYVLIDFWASWCPPCRAANPELVEVYKQFSEKNFTIVGISVDKNEESWKQAIVLDRLPWINVSSLNGWDTISEKYAVEAIPQNFLLDPQGIIIDKNIEPEHLIHKLPMIMPD